MRITHCLIIEMNNKEHLGVLLDNAKAKDTLELRFHKNVNAWTCDEFRKKA